MSYTSVANIGVVHFSDGDHFRLHDLPQDQRDTVIKPTCVTYVSAEPMAPKAGRRPVSNLRLQSLVLVI